MALKLAISGKGGVGKSTLAGTLARLWAADGCKVLAIDADPDANLASALGFPSDLRSSIRTISREAELIEERTGAKAGQFGQMFSINPDVSGIAEKYGVTYSGVSLLVLGAVKTANGGCACPESVLLKSLVRHLVLNRDEVVILDMEAGIEHMGRGTAMGVDMMVTVVEPGQRSVETAHRVREMARDLGIKRFAVVLNKSTDPAADTAWLNSEFGEDSVIGVIPYDTRIMEADRTGRALVDMGFDDLIKPFCEIRERLK
ncbi:MAG: AAA family ATPase [Armatimonadota bacterium]|nr:AAA family ATPase [bacterium]